MINEFGKVFSKSRGMKVAVFVSLLIVMMMAAGMSSLQQLEGRLKETVQKKLARVHGAHFEIGRLSLTLSGVMIDQMIVTPVGLEGAPSIVLDNVHLHPSLSAILRGSVPVDQLLVDRVATNPSFLPNMTQVTVKIDAKDNSHITLNFSGQVPPGLISGDLDIVRETALIALKGTLKGAGLSFFHPKIAKSPLDGIDADVTFSGRYDVNLQLLQVDEVKINSRGLTGILKGQIEQVKTMPRVALTLDVPTIPCQTLIEALPANFIPDLKGFQLAGNYAAQFKLDVDFKDLDATRLAGYRGFRDCETVMAPPHFSQDHFRSSFDHTTRLTGGINQTFRVGPENPNYVPYSQFSRALKGAFVATEDISFFHHPGFVPESLAFAIGQNLSKNRFAMGGSTITMQMVKNVFLSHEKTLSRKVQELFLTDYVERTLGKQRILEIYLNVIEFGPGIFGIGNAAEHFFGKKASQLSELESIYLASIIYSPRRHYSSYCQGQISPAWDRRLRQLAQLMRNKDLINEEEYLATEVQAIAFRDPAPGCGKPKS